MLSFTDFKIILLIPGTIIMILFTTTKKNYQILFKLRNDRIFFGHGSFYTTPLKIRIRNSSADRAIIKVNLIDCNRLDNLSLINYSLRT